MERSLCSQDKILLETAIEPADEVAPTLKETMKEVGLILCPCVSFLILYRG